MHNHAYHAPPDVFVPEKEEPGRTQISVVAFAGELVRLAEVVKHNLENGVAPIQTLSQLSAMEPIITLLRVTGLMSVEERTSETKKVTHAGYL